MSRAVVLARHLRGIVFVEAGDLGLELVHIVGNEAAQKVQGACATHIDHGHVRNIEDPGMGAHCHVFVDL